MRPSRQHSSVRGRIAEQFPTLCTMQTLNDDVLADSPAFARLVDVDAVLAEVVDPLQLATHANGPGDRRRRDAEHAFDFVEQLDGCASVAVELVGDDQGAAA